MAPLSRRRIVVTRTREQGSTLASALRALGAEVIEVPTIRIEPPASYAPLDAALARLAEFDVLLVTSANTARVLAERRPPPWGTQPYTVVIGPATAEALAAAGLRVDRQPEPSVAESVLQALGPTARGKRMLLVRAEQARDVLPDGLRAAGATVTVVNAYQTVVDEAAGPVLRELFTVGAPKVDAVTFTSSSTVRNFFLLLGDDSARSALGRSAACSIGPVTSATLRQCGVEPAVESLHFDVQGLVTAIEQVLQRA
jgi:uroporphyrinogen-III synthase